MSSGGTPTPVLPIRTEPLASAGTREHFLGQLRADADIVGSDKQPDARAVGRRSINRDHGNSGANRFHHGPSERPRSQALQDDAVLLGLGDRAE
jgi:hypothetical protein